jgi:hypothetical protein
MSADGTWKVTINSPMGVQQGTLNVKTEGNTFTGSFDGQMGKQDVSGTVDGDKLSWKTNITSPMPLELTFNITVSGDSLSGAVQAGAFGSSPVSGVRA